MRQSKTIFPWAKLWKLTVVRKTSDIDKGWFIWECKCECWNTRYLSTNALHKTKSCWCWHKFPKSHWMAYTSEYTIWRGILRRCNNKNCKMYRLYGGRWITVKFKSFEEFISYVGLRPWKWYSIDRIDNNKWYEPWNVRRATFKEQQRNKRTNVRYNIDGKRITQVDLAEQLWVRHDSIDRRIKKGEIKWERLFIS